MGVNGEVERKREAGGETRDAEGREKGEVGKWGENEETEMVAWWRWREERKGGRKRRMLE